MMSLQHDIVYKTWQFTAFEVLETSRNQFILIEGCSFCTVVCAYLLSILVNLLLSKWQNIMKTTVRTTLILPR